MGDQVRFVYGEPVAFEDQESTGDKCEDWLLGYLAAHGASKPGDVVTAGKDAGFTRDTIYRTRKSLQGMIRNTEKNHKAPGNRWRLFSDEDEDGENEEE